MADSTAGTVPASSLAPTSIRGDDPILQFFAYGQLSPLLQSVSRPFGVLAREMHDRLPDNPQRAQMLSDLLRAKDCAVRALLYREGYRELPQ